jgi:hypothetical protein
MGNLSRTTGIKIFAEQFADSPQLLSFIEANFGTAEHEAVRKDLLESADESEFSLRQWVESLRILRSWLDARGLSMLVEDELGYVHCASESAGSGSNLTYLPGLVSEMLETYGCERAEPRSASEPSSEK